MHTTTLYAQEPMAPGLFSETATDITPAITGFSFMFFLFISGITLALAVGMATKRLLTEQTLSPIPPLGMMIVSIISALISWSSSPKPQPTPPQPSPSPDQTTTPAPTPSPSPDPAPQEPPADYSHIWHIIGIIGAIIGIIIVALILGYVLRRIVRASLNSWRTRRKHIATRTNAWDKAQHLWFVLQAEYTEAETDPKLVLEYPLLTDISVPQTADFHKAFAKVRNLDHKTVPGTQEEVDAFADAVHDARIAFDTAMAYARLKGVSTFTSDQQRKLAQARKALDLALDDNASASERQAALDKVVALTSGIILLPTKATKPLVIELETTRRKELTT